MKILVDESCPRKLRNDFSAEHEVWTVRDKDWLGKKNGELLKLMVEAGFELFVTVDRNLPYQQNTENLPIPIVVLCASDNRRETLQQLIPKIFERLSEGDTKTIIEVF
jgi:predicted nuclease of predicted toxin-antitoxin system